MLPPVSSSGSLYKGGGKITTIRLKFPSDRWEKRTARQTHREGEGKNWNRGLKHCVCGTGEGKIRRGPFCFRRFLFFRLNGGFLRGGGGSRSSKKKKKHEIEKYGDEQGPKKTVKSLTPDIWKATPAPSNDSKLN